MNNNFYQNPMNNNLIENNMNMLLKFNRGKIAKFHVTIPNSIEWQDYTFTGIIEFSGKDYVILSNPNTGEWTLILLKYLDFITLDEPINYNKDFYVQNNG